MCISFQVLLRIPNLCMYNPTCKKQPCYLGFTKIEWCIYNCKGLDGLYQGGAATGICREHYRVLYH